MTTLGWLHAGTVVLYLGAQLPVRGRSRKRCGTTWGGGLYTVVQYCTVQYYCTVLHSIPYYSLGFISEGARVHTDSTVRHNYAAQCALFSLLYDAPRRLRYCYAAPRRLLYGTVHCSSITTGRTPGGGWGALGRALWGGGADLRGGA